MPFKPGQSGNPGGRKKALITVELEKIAKQVLPDGRTEAQALAQVMWDAAKLGEPIAYKYVTDRIDGSPVQTINADVNASVAEVDLSKIDPSKREALTETLLGIFGSNKKDED